MLLLHVINLGYIYPCYILYPGKLSETVAMFKIVQLRALNWTRMEPSGTNKEAILSQEPVCPKYMVEEAIEYK